MRNVVCLFLLWAFVFPAFTQVPPAAPAAIAEIEIIRGPYLRNVAAIRAGRDTRAASFTRTYTGTVERLQREFGARGDLEAALQAKAEAERVAGGQDPGTDERKAMPAALAQARQRYEQERGPLFAAAQSQETEQTRGYLVALDGLQKRLTTQNQLEKALAVKAERDRLSGLDGVVAGIAGPVAAPVARTVGNAALLDPALADRIAEVVKNKSYIKTKSSEGDKGGSDVPETGALLVGFEFAEDSTDSVTDIRSVRPLYLGREGIVSGKDRGELPKVNGKVEARNGYAVGGILIGHNKRRIAGIQVVFMKIDMRTGRLDPSGVNSYKSKWYGTRPRDAIATLAGDGRPVIGVWGQTGSDCDALGLITMP